MYLHVCRVKAWNVRGVTMCANLCACVGAAGMYIYA